MDFKTKYDVGDSVWFMHNNKVQNKKIESINVNMDSVGVYKYYNIVVHDLMPIKQSMKKFEEKDLFETKKELLNSL